MFKIAAGVIIFDEHCVVMMLLNVYSIPKGITELQFHRKALGKGEWIVLVFKQRLIHQN